MIAKRVYVHRSIYDEFVEKYIEAANRWIRIGDPFDSNTTIGPVNNLKQKNVVLGLVEDAQKRGAKVILSGKFWIRSCLTKVTSYNLRLFWVAMFMIQLWWRNSLALRFRFCHLTMKSRLFIYTMKAYMD